MNYDLRQRLEALDDSQRRQLAERLGLQAPTTTELVGFVSVKCSMDEETLHTFLADRLPLHMVPRRILMLGELPRSANGKVDRRALASIHLPLPEPRESTPLDALEQRLARIWTEVLELSEVGREEDFFELGGHSLLAMRLFSAIEKEFGITLPLAMIFSRPTVARLADALRPRSDTNENPCLVTLQEGSGLAPLFCIHTGGGDVFHYRQLAGLLGSERPVLGILPSGLDGQSSIYRSVPEMAQCYVDWVTDAFPSGPYLLCGYSFGGSVAYEMARRLRAAGREVAFLGLIDTFVYGKFSVADSLPRHRRSLGQLDLAGKLAYIGRSAWGNLRTLVRRSWLRIKSQGKLIQAKTFIATGRALPVRLRIPYVSEITGRAMLDYIPESYGGRVTVYRQEEGGWEYRGSPDLGWGEFVEADNLDVQNLPAKTHWDMMESPLVNLLATSMRQQFRDV